MLAQPTTFDDTNQLRYRRPQQARQGISFDEVVDDHRFWSEVLTFWGLLTLRAMCWTSWCRAVATRKLKKFTEDCWQQGLCATSNCDGQASVSYGQRSEMLPEVQHRQRMADWTIELKSHQPTAYVKKRMRKFKSPCTTAVSLILWVHLDNTSTLGNIDLSQLDIAKRCQRFAVRRSWLVKISKQLHNQSTASFRRWSSLLCNGWIKLTIFLNVM